MRGVGDKKSKPIYTKKNLKIGLIAMSLLTHLKKECSTKIGYRAMFLSTMNLRFYSTISTALLHMFFGFLWTMYLQKCKWKHIRIGYKYVSPLACLIVAEGRRIDILLAGTLMANVYQ